MPVHIHVRNAFDQLVYQAVCYENLGVVKHVGEALGDSLDQSRNNIVTIGIAPWGVIYNRGDLVGSEVRKTHLTHIITCVQFELLHYCLYCED